MDEKKQEHGMLSWVVIALVIVVGVIAGVGVYLVYLSVNH